MRFAPIESYQYVGFGSVAFIDFRMVHKALGIKNLISIEATEDPAEQTRFRHNNPYAGLALHFGHSSKVLPMLDLAKHSLVWLDYDNLLSRSMANDLATVARRAASGSFIGVTFTSAFPPLAPGRDKELKRLKEEFPDFLAEDAKASVFDGLKYAEFGRSVLGALLQKAISDADAGEQVPGKKRSAQQVCFFRYRDGAPMTTVAWVIASEEDLSVFKACDFDALPFVRRGAESFRIEIPLVTPFEVREMEKRLPNLAVATDLDWIPEEHRKNFCDVYRYLPHFSVVEQV
ncbi:MAG: hypothetical protein EOQ27_30050 [Mesorhizobium sp.]|nr:O-methyltransferase [Mesorhizobium sp.]RWA58380.1 MAG: hypothetical protein EOQ27_30050 [Mesorhizobium sp.]